MLSKSLISRARFSCKRSILADRGHGNAPSPLHSRPHIRTSSPFIVFLAISRSLSLSLISGFAVRSMVHCYRLACRMCASAITPRVLVLFLPNPYPHVECKSFSSRARTSRVVRGTGSSTEAYFVSECSQDSVVAFSLAVVQRGDRRCCLISPRSKVDIERLADMELLVEWMCMPSMTDTFGGADWGVPENYANTSATLSVSEIIINETNGKEGSFHHPRTYCICDVSCSSSTRGQYFHT